MSECITKLAPALLAAQKALGDAKKGASNPFFKSSYADLNAVREAVLPAFNNNGLSVLQPTVVYEGRNYVQTILLHESGEFWSSLTEIKVSKVNDAQAEGSGISYARRYGLQSFVNVGAVDDDGEKAVGRTKTTAPKVESVALPNGTTKVINLADLSNTVPSTQLIPSGLTSEGKIAQATSTAGQSPANLQGGQTTANQSNGTKKSSFKKTTVSESGNEWK